MCANYYKPDTEIPKKIRKIERYAQVSDDVRRVHPQRRHLELAE